MKPSRDIARLIEIMAALRKPGSVCLWDLEQTFATIGPYTLEEAFEVVELSDARLRRLNSLCSLSDDELSPAALAVRVELADCARTLVAGGRWAGARASHHES